MLMNDEKRGIEEIYTSAMTSSDLRVEADRPGDADVIIVSGWTQARIGGAMLRLHTEYDSSEKPRMAAVEQFLPALIEAAAAVAKDGKISKEEKRLLKVKAHRMTHEFNLNQTGLFLEKLKSLPDVRTQLSLQMLKWGMADVESKGAQIIQWWLHQVCPVCHGTKWQVAEGTGRQNGKACKECQGTGKRETPFENEGRRAATWMDQCIERHRAQLVRRTYDRHATEERREGRGPLPAGPQRVFLRPPKSPAQNNIPLQDTENKA